MISDERLRQLLSDMDERLHAAGVKPFTVQYVASVGLVVPEMPVSDSDGATSDFGARIMQMLDECASSYGQVSFVKDQMAKAGRNWENMEYALGKIQWVPMLEMCVLQVMEPDLKSKTRLQLVVLDAMVHENGGKFDPMNVGMSSALEAAMRGLTGIKSLHGEAAMIETVAGTPIMCDETAKAVGLHYAGM